MLYTKFLKEMNGCPFCELNKKEIIKLNKHAILTLARAPYSKDHLLIIPKKHETHFSKLSIKEQLAIQKLVFYALKRLVKKHKNVSVIYREGENGMKGIGKSISHLHIHLIPKIKVGLLDIKDRQREFMTEKNLVSATKKIKKEMF